MDSLSEDEAVELLLQRSETDDTEANRSQANLIVRKLACLALAVDQAAAYISLRHLPMTLFLQHYEHRKKAVLEYVPKSSLWEYQRCLNDAEKETSLSAFTTWEMSFQQIAEIDGEHDAIGHFLTLSAYFNPAKISEFLFSSCSGKYFLSGSAPDWLKIFSPHATWNHDYFQDVVSGLTNLSLIQHYESEVEGRDSSSWFTLHPLIRDWLQLRIGPEEQQKYFLQAIEVLNASRPASFIVESYVLADEILMHMQALLKFDEVHGLPDLEIPKAFLPVVRDLAFCALATSSKGLAEALSRKIVILHEKYFGRSSKSALEAIVELSFVYQSRGKFDKAIDTLQPAILAINTHFPNGGLLSGAVCQLARCYMEIGYFVRAEEALMRAPVTSSYSKYRIISDLSEIYQKRGDVAKAVNMMAQVLDRCRQEWGEHHSETLLMMCKLADLYAVAEKDKEAEAMYLRAFNGFVQYHTIPKLCFHLCNQLGKLYRKTHRYTEEVHWFKEAVRLGMIVYSPDKPESAAFIYTAKTELGDACVRAGQLVEAEGYYLELKADSETIRDPDTFGIACGLGIVYEGLGRLEDAASQFKEAKAIYETIKDQDPEHLAYVLGRIFGRLGRLEDAASQCEEAKAGCAKVPGIDHQHTRVAANEFQRITKLIAESKERSDIPGELRTKQQDPAKEENTPKPSISPNQNAIQPPPSDLNLEPQA